MPLAGKAIKKLDDYHRPWLHVACQNAIGKLAKIAGMKVVALVGAQAEVLDHFNQDPPLPIAVGANVAKLTLTTVPLLLFRR